MRIQPDLEVVRLPHMDAEVFIAWVRPSTSRKWLAVGTGTANECRELARQYAIERKWMKYDTTVTSIGVDANGKP